MKKTALFILVLLLSLNCFSQGRRNWTVLDGLNLDPEYPFQTESDIEGICFIVLSNTVSYYDAPIIVNDKEGKEIVRIEYDDSLDIFFYYL